MPSVNGDIDGGITVNKYIQCQGIKPLILSLMVAHSNLESAFCISGDNGEESFKIDDTFFSCSFRRDAVRVQTLNFFCGQTDAKQSEDGHHYILSNLVMDVFRALMIRIFSFTHYLMIKCSMLLTKTR